MRTQTNMSQLMIKAKATAEEAEVVLNCVLSQVGPLGNAACLLQLAMCLISTR